MIADDTNLFYSHNNVKELFRTMNAELSHLNDWFCANKLSLKLIKLSISCFIKQKVKTIFIWFSQICLLMMLESKEKTKQKFLGVMIDEN